MLSHLQLIIVIVTVRNLRLCMASYTYLECILVKIMQGNVQVNGIVINSPYRLKYLKKN